ncbi:MAG: hypothetical protein GY803_30755 [Chloroflexi bacterium]|nr:hypothetical protein [Chloroflexota bacterium]
MMNETEYTKALVRIKEAYGLGHDDYMELTGAMLQKAIGGGVVVSEVVTVVLGMVEEGAGLIVVREYLGI